MIEQSLMLALGANFLVNLPIYQSLVASRMIDNPKYKPPVMPKQNLSLEPSSPWSDLSDDQKAYRDEWNAYYDARNDYKEKVPERIESNWFARKPFNCLYCLTFWLGVLSILLFAISHGYVTGGMLSTIPASSMLAVIINRLYKALPVNI